MEALYEFIIKMKGEISSQKWFESLYLPGLFSSLEVPFLELKEIQLTNVRVQFLKT